MELPTDFDGRVARLVEQTALSEREAEVLVLKRDDRSHAAIARALEIEESTVDEYARRINSKQERARNTLDEIEATPGVEQQTAQETTRMRTLIQRLEPGDDVQFESTGRSTKQPFTVVETQDTGDETRVKMQGPRKGQMALVADNEGSWQEYADNRHADDPVRWELVGLSVSAGNPPNN